MKSSMQSRILRALSPPGLGTRLAVAVAFAGLVSACDVHSPTAPGTLASITVTPDVTLATNTTQQFIAVGRDAEGVVVSISPAWSVVASGGSINASSGLFTSGSTAGTYTNTVEARNGTIAGFASVVVTAPAPPPPPPPTFLGAAATHGILAGSTVTCVDLGVINADVSVSPGSAITGFPPCAITGLRNAANTYAANAQGDLTVAYLALAGMACGTTITADLGGTTLAPGVYCSGSSVGVTGAVTFDAQGDPNAAFIIQVPSALTVAGSVVFIGGAQAKNLYWQVGSSATIGTGSAMAGNILAFTSITLVDNATLLGRALARNGAVSLGTNNVITLP
jgi:hypothetical protein